MEFKTIHKSPDSWSVPPNLMDYEKTYREFSWDQLMMELDGLPNGAGLNIAHEAIDRHANGALRDKLALRWLGQNGEVRDFTYLQMKEETNRFANVLLTLGVGKGELVAGLAGRIPELYIACLGTLKNLSVFCPLFSAFGPEPIFQRLMRGEAKILVTTQSQYAKKIAPQLSELPHLKYILIADVKEDIEKNVLSLPLLMEKASPEFTIPPTGSEDRSVLHFTSGTTGMPKGAIHVHEAIKNHYLAAKYALDLHRDDIFWCTADPGWVT
jgi:acetyl-CoA synthetase